MEYPLSDYLKNSVFTERENEWQDEQSIYPQSHTVGCYPLNKMFPDNVASSRFENLGVPIGLIYYHTRPVGYNTKYNVIIGGNSSEAKDKDDDGEEECDEEEDENCKHSLKMEGGELYFDNLVKNIVEEKMPGNMHNKTRKIKRVK